MTIHIYTITQKRQWWNKNCLWWLCLLMDRDEMSNHYRGPSIGASYQVSIHLADGFQRRRLKCEKLTDNGRQTTDAKWWQKLTLPLVRWGKNVTCIKRSKDTTQLQAMGRFTLILGYEFCSSLKTFILLTVKYRTAKKVLFL
jgi:hypothetical protein